jgi:hypothetical protein
MPSPASTAVAGAPSLWTYLQVNATLDPEAAPPSAHAGDGPAAAAMQAAAPATHAGQAADPAAEAAMQAAAAATPAPEAATQTEAATPAEAATQTHDDPDEQFARLYPVRAQVLVRVSVVSPGLQRQACPQQTTNRFHVALQSLLTHRMKEDPTIMTCILAIATHLVGRHTSCLELMLNAGMLLNALKSSDLNHRVQNQIDGNGSLYVSCDNCAMTLPLAYWADKVSAHALAGAAMHACMGTPVPAQACLLCTR